MARRAHALDSLRVEINARWPGRDVRSDGWIGDAAHRSRPSDHNPNGRGVVCAIDVDEHTSTAEQSQAVGQWLWKCLRKCKDPRLSYVIYEERMFSSYPIGPYPAWYERAGRGHTQHVHVSLVQDPDLYDDPRAWDLSGLTTTTTGSDMGLPYLEDTSVQSGDIELVQYKLKNTVAPDLKPDGIVGPNTMAAVRKVEGNENARAITPEAMYRIERLWKRS